MKISSFKLLFLILSFIPKKIYSFKEWWEESNTLTLTNENFDDFVGNNKYVIVEFFTTWCKYCREMFPEYEKLFNYYNNNNTKRNDIIIARVDANKADVIALKYGIYQFPLIVMFYPKNKKIMDVFQGKRIFDFMKMWIEQRCPKIDINDNNEENKENKGDKNNNEEELKINSNNNNNSDLTEESEYVKMEFIDIKRRIKSLETNLNYINDILNNNFENKKNNTNNKNKNTKIIIELDINFFNILCLIIVLFVIYAIYNSISKILLNNKNK